MAGRGTRFSGAGSKRPKPVIEKQVVSDEATVGIYNFAPGCKNFCAAENKIKNELRINGEFAVASASNNS